MVKNYNFTFLCILVFVFIMKKYNFTFLCILIFVYIVKKYNFTFLCILIFVYIVKKYNFTFLCILFFVYTDFQNTAVTTLHYIFRIVCESNSLYFLMQNYFRIKITKPCSSIFSAYRFSYSL